MVMVRPLSILTFQNEKMGPRRSGIYSPVDLNILTVTFDIKYYLLGPTRDLLNIHPYHQDIPSTIDPLILHGRLASPKLEALRADSLAGSRA